MADLTLYRSLLLGLFLFFIKEGSQRLIILQGYLYLELGSRIAENLLTYIKQGTV